VKVCQGRLLTAVLARGAREGAAHLADQGATGPERPGLINERSHLRGRTTIARTRAEQNHVGLSEAGRLGCRHVREGLFRLDRSHFCENFRRECLCHLKQFHLSAGDLLCTLRDGFRQAVDMPVQAVENDLHLHSHISLLSWLAPEGRLIGDSKNHHDIRETTIRAFVFDGGYDAILQG